MQIKQTKKENLLQEFTVTLSADEIDVKINERLEEVGKTVSIPGFRPGKVPMQMLKSKYGQAVMGEVLEKAVNDSTQQAINENELRPAMQPKIEVKKFEEGKGLEYTMAVELLPEIKLGDFKKINLSKKVAKPDAAAVKESLDRIADANKASEAIKEKRATKKGDIIVIDFDGTVDGEPRDGMKGEDHHLELGTNSFIDTFEDQLTGKKAGDHVSVTVTFPDPYASAELAGKEAVFEVDIKEIHKAVKPKLDDEFAKKLGMDDLKSVNEAIEKQMQAEYDHHTRLYLKKDLLDALDDMHDFAVPAGMVEGEFKTIAHQASHQGHDHGVGEECNHEGEEQKLSKEDEKEYRGIAERRVKLGLVLAEVGRDNKIEISQAELQQAVIREAQNYPGQEAQVFEHYQKNPQALEMLRAPIFEDKTIDFILEIAMVEDTQVSVDELLKGPGDDKAKTTKGSAKKGNKKPKAESKKKESSKKADAKETKEADTKK